MIEYKTKQEISLLRESALLVSQTLALLAQELKPGITTKYLDEKAYEFIKDNNAEPAFLGLYDFPATLCTSINEQVVHGIPSNYELKEGDIISIDCGVKKNDFIGDHAYTFTIGEVKKETLHLLKITKECLYLGIEKMVQGNRIGDISFAIQSHAEKNNFGVVRELVGHGVGRKLHEDPQVPNYGKRGKGTLIKEGLVLAIEPMINQGTHKVKQLQDGWTIIAADRKPSAHFEHNVAIVDGKPEILSSFDIIEEILVKKGMPVL